MRTYIAAPVFHVADLDRAITHYREVFGFTQEFRYDNYAGVRLDEIAIHLASHSRLHRPIGGSNAYILCDEVDAYYDSIKRRGAILKSTPTTAPYGMRDFIAVDLDGNYLSFGCEVPKK
jgi:uncharacterized glyoxalase superfamily protein PhnB